MAGAVIGVSYFQEFRLVQSTFLFMVGGGVVCALALGTYGDRMMKERLVPNLLKCPVDLGLVPSGAKARGS